MLSIVRRPLLRCLRTISAQQQLMSMNRPRNRQPRSNDTGRGRGKGRAGGDNQRQHRPSYPSNVPNVSQVRPGAAVSIVLKQDQATGNEVSGIVQDVLTNSNHPRGIKVRMADGRVGRVQRMVSQAGTAQLVQSSTPGPGSNRDVFEEQIGLPPTRTLADFIPEEPSAVHDTFEHVSSATITQCPVCNDFRGDEIAVSRHVETHFS